MTPFDSVIVGFAFVICDVTINGFDLLPDVVGFAAIALGAHRLQRHAPDFTRTTWAAVVHGVFALAGAATALGRYSSFPGSEWSARIGWLDSAGVPSLLFGYFEFFVGFVVVWSCVSGIATVADHQQASKLSARTRWVRGETVAFGVLLFTVGIGSGNPKPLLAWVLLLALLWMSFRILSLLIAARRRLDVGVGTRRSGLPKTLPPIERAIMSAATVIAVTWLLNIPNEELPAVPSEVEPLDTSTPIPAPPPDLFIYEAAVERQPAALINRPASLLGNGPDEGCRVAEPPLLVGIDLSAGEPTWALRVPALGDALMTVDDTMLIVDQQLGEFLPSVSAIDPSTGRIRWQRMLEAVDLTSLFLVEDGALLATVSPPGGEESAATLVVVDGDGQLVTQPASDESPNAVLNVSSVSPVGEVGGATLHHEGSTSFLRLVTATGRVVDTDPIPFDTTYSDLGNESSLGAAVQIGADTAVVTLGSSVGPNSRVVVFDLNTGAERWRVENLRSAAIGNLDGEDVIVYDKRNTAAADSAGTRDLFVVDADDPDDLKWTAELSVNDSGGNGFLGSTDAGLVFAVDETVAGPPSLLTVAAGDDGPSPIVAADRLGGGSSPRHHLGDDLVALIVDDGVLIERSDGTREVVPLDRPAVYVARSGDELVVGTQVPPDCG